MTTDVILASLEWQFALGYLDDTFFFLKTPEKHIDHIEQVLTLVRHAGDTLIGANAFSSWTRSITFDS